jgi:hypothetical protein
MVATRCHHQANVSLAVPSPQDFNSIKSWLQRAYPVAEVQLSFNTVNAKDFDVKGSFICNDVNAAVQP